MAAEILGKCPACGGNIFENPKAYSCGNFKDKGCKFAIWKNQFEKLGGKPITTAQAKALLGGKEIDLKGLVSNRTGKQFDAKGVIEKSDQYGWGVQFKFPEKR